MQRRLRNSLAIAVAGGALIIGAGTAFAATPGDDVAGSAPPVDSSLDQVGTDANPLSADTPKSKDSEGTEELGSSADGLSSAPELGDTAPLTGGVDKAPLQAPEVGGPRK